MEEREEEIKWMMEVEENDEVEEGSGRKSGELKSRKNREKKLGGG